MVLRHNRQLAIARALKTDLPFQLIYGLCRRPEKRRRLAAKTGEGEIRVTTAHTHLPNVVGDRCSLKESTIEGLIGFGEFCEFRLNGPHALTDRHEVLAKGLILRLERKLLRRRE